MGMQAAIVQKLQQALAFMHLEVVNESGGHNVPPGAETHFKVVVVSADFTGQSPVQRHRRVYGILADELAASVHALAIHAYTPEEWQARSASAPASPACRGGSSRQGD